MEQAKILCVDDEIHNIEALERIFRKSYVVLTATSGQQALEVLKEHEVAVIISDQRMPQMKGVEFLKKSMGSHPEAIRILLTGYTDMNSVIEAINTGQVYRYINKPWDVHDLQATVARAVERYHIQQQLQQKTKALEKAYIQLKALDQAKSQFMLLIHHELKTPLTTISSFLELLNQSSLDKDQALYCEKIHLGVCRLNELIFTVLEIMEAETGRLKPFKSPIHLKPFCNQLLEELTPLAHAKNQVFHTDIAENLNVHADQKILGSVLKRLLGNAIKFGNKQSTITLQATAIEKNLVKISITNASPTISKEVLEQISKPFVLNENILHHSQGLGLGLNLCQALLKCHGTELEITSQEDSFSVSYCLQRVP